jgi:hypothetical protein
MGWNARVTNIMTNNSVGDVIIQAVIEQTDAEGAVINTWPDTLIRSVESLPTPEELSLWLKQRTEKRAMLMEQHAPILSMIGKDIPMPVDPPMFPEEVKLVSGTDRALIALKNEVKPLTIAFIKDNPACDMEDILDYFSQNEASSHMAAIICPIYQHGAAAAGLINDDTWMTFRDWIVATPLDQLLAI